MDNIITTINYWILCYFVFSVAAYSFLLICAFPEIIRIFKTTQLTNIKNLINQKMLPPVTVLVPIHNEEILVVESIKALLKSNYPNLYIILINDASTDSSMELLNEVYHFEEVPIVIEEKLKTSKVLKTSISKINPRLMLIDKEHGGTGDSLNVGVNACSTPYFVIMDSDSFIDPDAITEMMVYILTHQNVIAVGGGVYLLNGCVYKEGKMIDTRLPKSWIAALQSNEYLRSHLFNRTSWNRFNGTMSYSGTATAYFRQAILDIDGFDRQNFAHDAEIILHLHQFMQKQKRTYKIGFSPAVSVWTDVPDTIRSYTTQQNHWRRGLMRSTLRYWYMFLNPRYGTAGLIAYPMFMILEMLAPIVEFTAYFMVALAYYYGLLNGMSAFMYVILAWGFSSYITMANAFINLITFNRYRHIKDILWTFGLAFIDMLGFRQYLTAVKIWSTIHYAFNRLIGRPV